MKIIKKVIVLFDLLLILASCGNKPKVDMVPIPDKNFEVLFEMLNTEVTQELYISIMGNNPSYFKGGNLPVESVCWYDAIEFCNALSRKLKLAEVYTINGKKVTQNISANGFRLPTEEEWEYAAKGGVNYTYAGSNNLDDIAWYYDNSERKTHPVAQKNANGFGLYDMSGNVWEWCWDVDQGYRSDRIRGGSWYNGAGDCEVSRRHWFSADDRNNGLGFRVVRNKK